MKQIASRDERKETGCDAASVHLSVRFRSPSRTIEAEPCEPPVVFISLPTRPNSQIGERPRRPRICLPSSLLSPVRARSIWVVRIERASDGAAVDDPGVRGGGGGGGCCAGHAPGAPRRAGPDRRAHVLAPAAHGQRDTLRCLPAPRCVRRPPPPRPPAGAADPSQTLIGLLFCDVSADIYWKKEHRLMCTSEICTAEERIRFEKSVSGRFSLCV